LNIVHDQVLCSSTRLKAALFNDWKSVGSSEELRGVDKIPAF
jgi:hypothetical protein